MAWTPRFFTVQQGEKSWPVTTQTRDFFRPMPNALLARYFAGRTVFGEFDFAAMSETRHDELFAAWLALPEAQRNAMDAGFRDVFEMSCEKGCRAILDEAQSHLAKDADFAHAARLLASQFRKSLPHENPLLRHLRVLR